MKLIRLDHTMFANRKPEHKGQCIKVIADFIAQGVKSDEKVVANRNIYTWIDDAPRDKYIASYIWRLVDMQTTMSVPIITLNHPIPTSGYPMTTSLNKIIPSSSHIPTTINPMSTSYNPIILSNYPTPTSFQSTTIINSIHPIDTSNNPAPAIHTPTSDIYSFLNNPTTIEKLSMSSNGLMTQ